MDECSEEIRILVDHAERSCPDDTQKHKSNTCLDVLGKRYRLYEVPRCLEIKVDSQFGL